MSSVRKYKGRYWHIWYETDDDGNAEVVLCHKKYHLLLHPEEFSDLVESINKASYGILGKKGLLMDDSDHKNP